MAFSGVTSQGPEAFHATFAVSRTTSSGIAQNNFVRVAVNRDTTDEIVTARDKSELLIQVGSLRRTIQEQ